MKKGKQNLAEKSMPFYSIADAYIDGCIDIWITSFWKERGKELDSWEYQFLPSVGKQNIKNAAILSHFKDGSPAIPMWVNLTEIMDCRCRQSDLERYALDNFDPVQEAFNEIVEDVLKEGKGGVFSSDLSDEQMDDLLTRLLATGYMASRIGEKQTRVEIV